MNQSIIRSHYRARLNDTCLDTQLQALVQTCVPAVQAQIDSGHMMTAAMYRYDKMLFLYTELIVSAAVSASETVPVPVSDSANKAEHECSPDSLFSALKPVLHTWPGESKPRVWIGMPQVFYHTKPLDIEDWRRKKEPEMRRGRIAFLVPDKMFNYVYHHQALVREGSLKGDKYQSIGMHENILFSYLEEPRTPVNMRRDENCLSAALSAWEAEDPESHFMHDRWKDNFNYIDPVLIMA